MNGRHKILNNVFYHGARLWQKIAVNMEIIVHNTLLIFLHRTKILIRKTNLFTRRNGDHIHFRLKSANESEWRIQYSSTKSRHIQNKTQHTLFWFDSDVVRCEQTDFRYYCDLLSRSECNLFARFKFYYQLN